MTTARLAFGALALACATSTAAQKACTKPDESNANKAIDRITSWSTLNGTWKTYRHCDTGAVGEQFTEAILRLVIDWKNVDQLANAMKDQDYNDFIVKHLKSPEAKADAPDVYSRAKANCPKNLEAFCKDIAAAVKEEPAPTAAAPTTSTPELIPPIRPPAPPAEKK
jgi:hypothetical protein